MAENAFRYNVVTYDGLALMAQATAANPIVIVGTLSTARSCNSESELAAKDASWYNGRAGVISSSSATANRAKIVGRYDAEGLRQDVRSVCITARLQSSQNVVVLCAKSDPDSTVTIPGEADTGQQAYFSFTIDIASQGIVEVTPGASATLADLDRFVSVHAAGNPAAGESQTILGEKTFASNVTVDGDIIPATDGGYKLGDSIKGWVSAHIEELFCSNVYTSKLLLESGSQSARISMNGTNDMILVPESGQGVLVAGYMYVEGNFAIDGEISCNIVPTTGGTYTLGESGQSFSDCWCNNFHGCIPTVESGDPPEVGAIFFGGFGVASNLNANCGSIVELGQPLYSGGNNVTSIGVAAWDSHTNKFSISPWIAPAGKYKLLSGAIKSASEDYAFAMMMRIE